MKATIVDDRGRAARFSTLPARIVSLVPSDTYTLVELGAGPRLVGRTRYCVEPAAAVERVPIVGGVRDPDLAAVQALRPDVVVASVEDNREQDVLALEAAGIPVVVGHPRTVRAGLEHARRLGALLLGSEGPTTARLERACADVEAILGRTGSAALRPAAPAPRGTADASGGRQRGTGGVRVLVAVWPEPVVVLGPATHGADVVALAGAELVAPASSGDYPRPSADELRSLEPDVLLLPDEPYEFGADEGELLRTRIERGRSRPVRVVRCDGKDLFWYGLRAIDGLGRLAALLSRS